MANNYRHNSFETAEANPYGDSSTRYDSILNGYTVSKTCPPDEDYNSNETMPPEANNPYNNDRRRDNSGSGAYISTQPTDVPTPAPNPYSERTEIVDKVSDAKNIRPVVGWLIGTKGECKYKDFRLHSGHNRIGRGNGNKVNIDIIDTSVSREGEVEVIFNSKDSSFHLKSCNGVVNNSYCNDELLLDSCRLKDGDRIQLGKSELIFKSLCGESFNWDNEKD